MYKSKKNKKKIVSDETIIVRSNYFYSCRFIIKNNKKLDRILFIIFTKIIICIIAVTV